MESGSSSSDARFSSNSSRIRMMPISKPYSPCQVSLSLGILGFSSWATLVPGKISIFNDKKCHFNYFSNFQFDNNADISTFIH